MKDKPMNVNVLQDEQARLENRCRSCAAKLQSSPLATDGKIKCTNHYCGDCCQRKCKHPTG